MISLSNRMFSRFSHVCISALLVVALCGNSIRADILVVGEAGEAAVAGKLGNTNVPVRRIDGAQLAALDATERHVVLLAEDKPLPPETRRVLDGLLRRGGRVALVGPRVFDYAPMPANPVPVSRYAANPNYRVKDARARGEDATLDPVRVETDRGPDGQPALTFRTYLRGMEDFRVEFDLARVRAQARSVLQFWARGDAYMDVMALEIRDTRNRRWLGFVPLAREWRQHAISLADFLPEGWSDPDKPYPLLDPGAVATVAFGTNRLVVWTEKPMTFSLGSVALTEDASGFYAPTSALLPLRLPFLENGIKIPSWLFDPFAGAEPAAATPMLKAQGVAQDIAAPARTWVCPVPFLELPGTRMGTDHRKDYRLKFEREMRREPLLRTVMAHDRPGQTVAELRVPAAGPHLGGAIALFGISPADLRSNAALAQVVADTVAQLATKPRIAGATINTTQPKGGATTDVLPQLKIVVQNPLDRELKGRVAVDVADGLLRGEKSVLLPAGGVATVQVPLSAVPEDFPFTAFSWRVTLETDSGRDELSDRVDVERALLHASRHMMRTQQAFPDGRISNHYFGDAYGARAMIAYTDLVRRDPARLKNNTDLWRDLTPQGIEASALRFFDMLVERQNDDGSVPMGYGENRSASNVADMGQMAIGIGQVASLLGSPRREQYLQFCRSFVDAAETFYIDEKLAAELTAKYPDKAKKGETKAGNYGLGWAHLTRTQTGPWWVLPDILGVQVLLTYFDSNPAYRRIYERNIRFFLDAGYGAVGYFHAEALMWVYLTTPDQVLRDRIVANLRSAFLPPLLKGEINDMYDLGARTFLKGLPLIYFRRYVADDAGLRAVQLKYVWSFASEDAPNAMRRIAEQHPKPIHGESIAAAKQAACGAIWAVELLNPGSSLLRHPNFPAARRTSVSP